MPVGKTIQNGQKEKVVNMAAPNPIRSAIALNARYKPKKCLDCGKTFIPLSGSAKRCPECRNKGQRNLSRGG